MPAYKQLPAISLLILFAVSVALSFVVAEHRYKALAIGNLEYSDYLEFTVKAFDPSIAPRLSINAYSDGGNMFFRVGADSATSIWQWVHFEPIKVIPALLYALTHSVLASYIFYIVLFFLPLLYGAYLLWKHASHSALVCEGLIALAVYPSSFFYATYDLHSFYTLQSLFVCFILSLVYRRPLAEKIIFLSLFLLVREEALILGAAALVWELFRNRRDGASQRDIVLLWYVWGGWLAVTALWDLYTLRTAYVFHPPLPGVILFPALLLGVCGLLALLWWLWQRGTALWTYAPDALFGLLALSPALGEIVLFEPVRSPLRLVYGRSGFTFFYVLIAILIAYFYDHNWSGMQKKVGILFLSACIALFIASEAIPHASSTMQYVARWDAAAPDEQLVYRAAQIIPNNMPVLLDSTTIVAFYAHDNAYAYDYLPYWLPEDHVYTFPENTPELRKIISSGISYVVLLNADADPLLKLIKETGKSTLLVEQNSKFSFYRIK